MEKSTEYDFTNFYNGTYATWHHASMYECDILNTKPDYVSASGSRYWYRGNEVYRFADHWGEVASCIWDLYGACGAVLAKCRLSAFRPVEDRPKTAVETLRAKWAMKITKKENEMLHEAEKRAQVRTFETIHYPLSRIATAVVSGRLSGIPMTALEGSAVLVSGCTYDSVPYKKWIPEGTVCRFEFKSGRPRLVRAWRGCTDRPLIWDLSETAKEWLCNNV